ncbi:MAG: hypothetical protein P8R42_08995 [Candidatus Binatia bacterium]|nr:hypothetical protein [Candidatus Binatia bacterium]
MARALSFLLRAVVGVTAVYLLWIPLGEPTLVVVARATEVLLSWVWTPPLITGLEVSGDTVNIRGLFFTPGQWMGRWAAGNLPLFVIGSLGLSIAVPVRGWADRWALIGGTLLVCFLVMVAISAVEVLTVSAVWAKGREGVLLLSEPERQFIEQAHGSIDFIQMLLPATLALLAYGFVWAEEGSTDGRSSWAVPMWLWGTFAAVFALSMLPTSPPGPAARLARFQQTAELNPRSAEVWFAYARAASRTRGARGAVDAFEQAMANGANPHAARIGIAESLLASGRPGDALTVAQQALRDGPPSPRLVAAEATALTALRRPCDAVRQIEMRARGELPPVLVRTRRVAEKGCAAVEGG